MCMLKKDVRVVWNLAFKYECASLLEVLQKKLLTLLPAQRYSRRLLYFQYLVLLHKSFEGGKDVDCSRRRTL